MPPAAIHTDLAKGFIRAETVAYEDLVTLGSMAEARKARPAPLRGQDLPGPRRGRARDPVLALSQFEAGSVGSKSAMTALNALPSSSPVVVVVVIVVVLVGVGQLDLELGRGSSRSPRC